MIACSGITKGLYVLGCDDSLGHCLIISESLHEVSALQLFALSYKSDDEDFGSYLFYQDN